MYKYKYCLIRIWGETLEERKERLLRLKKRNEDQNIINMLSNWEFKNNYYLSGSISIIYTNRKRTQKQIEKDYFQQLFEDAYNNYNFFTFNQDKDDDYIDENMKSNDESEYLYFKSNYNDIFNINVTNNSEIDQNKNFELTAIIPDNFDSIAFHIPDFLQNFIIKDSNNKIIKEIHNHEKIFDSYINGFTIKS